MTPFSVPQGLGRWTAAVFGLLLWVGSARASEVPLVVSGGVYTVPVRINDVLVLNFVLDSGASEVQIGADVAQRLLEMGAIRQEDFIEGRTYTLADGSQVKSRRFMIRRFQLGDRVVDKVSASVGSARGPLLIGQSLLSRFPAWSLDNRRRVLILGDDAIRPAAAEPPAPAAPPPQAADPSRTLGIGGPDRRDQRALRALCQSGARAFLDCP